MRISRWSMGKSQRQIVFEPWTIGYRLWTICLLALLASCSTKDAKFQQYYVQGQMLYEKNCSNCHQKNGKGLGLLFPPLASSDYLKKNFNASLCLMKYGKQ